MSSYVELAIEQGATFSKSVPITDAHGTPRDLTNYTAKAQLRRSYYSKTANDFTVTIDDAANGVIVIGMSAPVTANLKPGRAMYDIVITDASTPNVVTRVSEGIASILAGVTK